MNKKKKQNLCNSRSILIEKNCILIENWSSRPIPSPLHFMQGNKSTHVFSQWTRFSMNAVSEVGWVKGQRIFATESLKGRRPFARIQRKLAEGNARQSN